MALTARQRALSTIMYTTDQDDPNKVAQALNEAHEDAEEIKRARNDLPPPTSSSEVLHSLAHALCAWFATRVRDCVVGLVVDQNKDVNR